MLNGTKTMRRLERQGEQKPTDKVEPKFKVGDKIRKKAPRLFDKDMQVSRIEKGYYVCDHIGKFSSEVVWFSKESSYELVEQKPGLSEEDIVAIDCAVEVLSKNLPSLAASIERLKSLRPQNHWKPSDEQMYALKEACDKHWEPDGLDPLYTLYRDLKKLREE